MTDNTNTNKKKSFSFRPGAILYAVLFVYALLMTQLLRNAISAVFFWFMLLILPISIIIMIIGSAVIQVYVFTDKNSTEKNSPVNYEIRIINNSPIPIPFVEAVMTKPQDNGVRCKRQRLILSMAPFGGYSVKTDVAFRYRGLYEIGVSELYIHDPLRMFCIHKDISNYSNINVSPRTLDFDGDMERATSDTPSPASRVNDTRERAEVTNIREYRIGDQLKNVHWKLSSKAEELQVKDYSTNNDRHTYIFIDLAAPTPAPIPEENKKRRFRDIFKRKKRADKAKKSEAITVKEPETKVKINKKKRRLQARGVSSKDAETIEMIDALIFETTAKGKAKKEKEAREASRRQIAAAEKLADTVEAESGPVDKRTAAVSAWGGEILSEFEDEIAEYCADGVVEIAVSAIMNELQRGCKCTVAWYDGREDHKLTAVDIVDTADIYSVTEQFASAPVVSCDCRVSDLTRIIGESVNVTVKIVTANIDPISVNEYCAVPTMFGGAGTGCSTEILLFDPEEKYTSPTDRFEYTSSAYIQLRQWGIEMSEIKEHEGSDGRTHFYNFNE